MAQEVEATAKQVKATTRSLGDLNNRLGEIVEHLMSPDLRAKFYALGYHFDYVSRDYEVGDGHGRNIAEVDVFLGNREFAMAVEVKTKLTQDHVDEHLKRMERLRHRADELQETRKYLGAVASVVIKDEVKNYALVHGLFVIEQSGDTVHIEPPAPDKLRQW
jgi:hypothetical protein